MAGNTYKETDRFCIKTLDGEEHVVVETTEFINITSMSGTDSIPGLKTFITANGDKVNYKGGNRYTIVNCNKEAVRNDSPR